MKDCERVVSEVIERHGKLDILVNNAGVTADRTVRKMTPEEWNHVVGVNLSGAFYMSRAVLPHMLELGTADREHQLHDRRDREHRPGELPSAKAGLFGLTKSLALEMASKGITVNCVAPGFIETEMTEAVADHSSSRSSSKSPCRRFGQPEEVARLVEFHRRAGVGVHHGSGVLVNGGLYM